MGLDISNNESSASFPHSSASFPMSVESATSASTSSTPISTHDQLQCDTASKPSDSPNLQSRARKSSQSSQSQHHIHNHNSEIGSSKTKPPVSPASESPYHTHNSETSSNKTHTASPYHTSENGSNKIHAASPYHTSENSSNKIHAVSDSPSHNSSSKTKSTAPPDNISTYHHVFKIVPSSGATTTLNSINYTYCQFDRLTVKVPSILLHCFDYIHRHPPVEGIFRINGSVRRINHVYQHLVQNGLLDDESLASFAFTVHDVCGVIKKFLKTFLPSIDELFNNDLLSYFQSLYDEYNKVVKNSAQGEANDDKLSMESFKTASGSLGSSGPISPLDHLLTRFTNVIVDQNTRFKNNLFLYVIYNLHRLSASESVTKMTCTNYSIVFQPYLFNTTNLSSLVMLQELLNVLIGNYPQLISRYSHSQSSVAPIETTGNDDVTSINSVESMNVSPITNNSQVQHYDHIFDNLSTPNPDEKSLPSQQQQQHTSTASKRRSLSNRFSALLDGYYAPTNKKRFSFGLATTTSPVAPTEPAPVTSPISDAHHQQHNNTPFHKSTEMLIDAIAKAEQDTTVANTSQLVVPKSRSTSTGTGCITNDISSISTDNDEFGSITQLTPDLVGSGYSTYPYPRVASRSSSYQGRSTDQFSAVAAGGSRHSSFARSNDHLVGTGTNGGSRQSSFARSNDHLVGPGAGTNGGSRQSSIVRSSEQLLPTSGSKPTSGISRSGSLSKSHKFSKTNASLPLKSNDSLIESQENICDRGGDSAENFSYDPNSTAASTTSRLTKEDSRVKQDVKSKRRSFLGLFKKNNSSSSVVSTPRQSTYIPSSMASPARPLSPSLVASAPFTPETAQIDVMPNINNDSPKIASIPDYRISKSSAATPRSQPSPLMNASKGSVDDILLTNHENSLANAEQKQHMLGRNFSLRGRSKRY